MKSIEEGYKRIYADNLAAGLGFEWDFESAADHDLYEAIEAMGYTWDGNSWLAPELQRQRDAARLRAPKPKKARRQKADVRKRLQEWNAGKPIGSKP